MTVTRRPRRTLFDARACAAIVAACAVLAAAAAARGSGPPPPPPQPVTGGAALPGGPVVLWDACTRDQAERWAADAGRDGAAALRAAACYAAIVERSGDKSAGLEDARKGRAAAEAAVRQLPGSGLAHYLAAYLAGLVAERSPLRGLALVPVIEREALAAVELDPAVDRGGPDRMLGELYLRAPRSPFSVGNPEKAVRHYRRAVAVEPAAPENRLGLAEALLARDETAEACRELRAVLAAPATGETPARRKAQDLLERACGSRGAR